MSRKNDALPKATGSKRNPERIEELIVRPVVSRRTGGAEKTRIPARAGVTKSALRDENR
jgi:hypothetical protein